jgi:hypothetical protein
MGVEKQRSAVDFNCRMTGFGFLYGASQNSKDFRHPPSFSWDFSPGDEYPARRTTQP